MHATSAALTPSSTLFQFTLDNQEGPETQTQALSFKTPSMCPSWIDRMERSIQRPGRLRSRGVFSGAAPRQIPAQQAKTAKHKLFLIPEKVLGLFENDSCLRISFNPCCSIHGVAAVQFHRGATRQASSACSRFCQPAVCRLARLFFKHDRFWISLSFLAPRRRLQQQTRHFRTQPGHHQASVCGCTPRPSPTHPSCTQSGKCLSAVSPAPKQKARPARGADRAFFTAASRVAAAQTDDQPTHHQAQQRDRPLAQ